MKLLISLFLMVTAMANCPAQTLLLKNGSVAAADGLVRNGDRLMTSIKTSSGGTGQIGFQVADVAQLNLPEPEALAGANNLIAKGEYDQAFALIDPVLTYQKTLRDIPGNWWAKTAVVEVTALMGLNRQADAIALVNEISANTKDPEVITAAKLQIALVTKYKETQQAMDAYDSIINQTSDPRTLSQAWLAKANLHFAEREFDEALLDYLTVTVFYPDHNPFLPKALWGSGQAYAKLKDGANATKTYQQLISSYPSSPEASQAKAELTKKEKKT